jgi:hypothetical protein
MMSLPLSSNSVEHMMVRSECRSIFAVVAVFVALAGIAASIRGLLFDEPPIFHYSVAALIGGVACFALLLNSPRDGNT